MSSAQDGLLSGMVMGGIGGAMNPSFCFVAGTAVLTAAGHRAIEDVTLAEPVEVYNFEVEDCHTYFVGCWTF